MSREIYQCQCPICQREDEHPDRLRHRQINLLMSRLDEQQRRWFVALETFKLRHGGIALMSAVTGVDEKTIRRGREELEAELQGRPVGRVRLEGGGQPAVEKKRRKSSRT